MPFSYWFYKPEIKSHFYSNIDPNIRILDVGPGAGTYAKLLRPTFRLDGLEIFEPYIDTYKLKELYNVVHVGDIRTFDASSYDYLIMGDVFEHLSESDANSILTKFSSKKILLAVPYMYKQGKCYDNIHETHLQPELTEDIMVNGYGLKKLFGNDKYGYFINY